MSTRLSRLFGSTPAQRRTRYGVLVAAVIAVPLAVAGLVSGALGGAGENLEQIPAVVVNNDEMVTMTLPDGTEQPVLAGRQLVTELTGPETAGFSWTISNDEEAAELLSSGDAYAVLTIPADFSESVTSISGETPTQANLDIRTDDAHGYLAGSVGQSVGDAMSTAFGRELTTQYLEGFYENLGTMGGSLGEAADGATQLSSGVDSLATGLGTLADGVGSAASGATDAANGAAQYAAGVSQYTSGVDGIAGGVATLSQQAGGLDGITDGISQYVAGVRQTGAGVSGGIQQYVDDGVRATGGALTTGIEDYADGAGQLAAGGDTLAASIPLLVAADPTGAAAQQAVAEYAAQVRALADGADQLALGNTTAFGQLAAGGDTLAAESGAGIETLAQGGDTLVAQTGAGIDGLQGGIGELAGGAAQLSSGSGGLRSGADGIASGVDGLAGGLGSLHTGTADAATGATKLATGAGTLADGLTTGAQEASVLADIDAASTAEVIAEPVTVDATRDHEIGSTGEVIGMLFLPIGLWLGAMAMFLVFRPFGREALRSTASTGGLVWRTLARAGLLAIAQAVTVVALLHASLGVDWSLLPQTLAFATLLALAFTALHAFLTVWLGRAGLLVSLVLVALQLTASGGLYPVEILSGPYQAISPFLPLTWAVQGMQLIVAGASGGAVAAAAGMVALFGLVGVIGTLFAVGRRRGIRSIGFAAAALG